MKNFISLCLLLITIVCSSQTKKESEDWLVYYLNKYFNSDYNSSSQKKYLREGKSYNYTNRKYNIISGNLIVNTIQNQIKDSNVTTSSLVSQKRTTIKLSRVIKVSNETSDKSAHNYGIYWVKVFLEFSEADFNDLSVEEYDELNKKDLTGKRYINKWQLTSENHEEVVKDGFQNKLIKAFEKVAEYNGGKVIKEVF